VSGLLQNRRATLARRMPAVARSGAFDDNRSFLACYTPRLSGRRAHRHRTGDFSRIPSKLTV
jgi:hypothetical protein